MKEMLLKALRYFPFCFCCCLATPYCTFIEPGLCSVYSWRVGRSVTSYASQRIYFQDARHRVSLCWQHYQQWSIQSRMVSWQMGSYRSTVASEVWWLPGRGRPCAGHWRPNRRRRKGQAEWAVLSQIPGRHFEYSKSSRLGKSSRRLHSEGDIPKELVSKMLQCSPRTKGLPWGRISLFGTVLFQMNRVQSY